MFRLILLVLISTSIYSQHNSNYPKREFQTENKPSRYALSSTYLIDLVLTEAKIYKTISNYTKALEKQVEVINAYLDDYEDSTLKLIKHSSEMSLEEATKVASHPIASFRMIRRFSQDLFSIWNHLIKHGEIKLRNSIQIISDTLQLPNEIDLEEAAEAILRIHYLYDLKLEQFANGNIMGVETRVGLSPSQMLEIANYAISQNYSTLAMDWLRVAESKITENNNSRLTSKLNNLYKNCVENHDQNYYENLKHDPIYIFANKLNGSKQPVKLQWIDYQKWKGVKNSDDAKANHYTFLALCNGENFQSEKQKATLNCWFDKRHPYFYLFPLKAEKLNDEPLIIQFHQIISDEWTQEFKIAAKPKLLRAPLPNASEDTLRQAIYAWLDDTEIKADISKRIELITGLNVKGKDASVDLQIASYAYGGYVDLHYDSFGERLETTSSLKIRGETAATFLIYLNDIERGGLTAFPLLGLSVKPVKGSAIFWNTALRNGNVDMRMMHAACPVVLGHKWIATKWTYLNENFLTRPCHLMSNV